MGPVARVELQALTDDRRIAGEAAGPECVAQDHDPSAALSIFLGKERPAVQDRRPEHGEEVIADAGGVNIVGFAAREVEIEIEGLRHRGRFERADAREPVDGVSRSDVETTRARLRVVDCQTVITRSGCDKSSGRMNSASATLTIAVVAPMPTAKMRSAMTVKPGVLTSMRAP